MRITILSVILILSSFIYAFGQQKYRLANEYFNSGEYSKAGDLYLSLYNETNKNKFYLNLHLQCLLELREYEKAAKLVQTEIKNDPSDVSLYVMYGNILEKQGFIDKADVEYKKAINNLDNNTNNINNLGSTFTNLSKYELAVQAYLKGEKNVNIPNLYAYNLADLYRRMGDSKNMIKYFLITAEKEQNIENIKSTFQRFLSDDDIVELQRQLYQKIQAQNSGPVYGELLEWTFMQKKEYGKALRQAKAMDRQFQENGSRVFNIGTIVYKDEDYTTAIEAFSYIVDNHDKNSSYYIEAKQGLLNSKKAKVVKNFDYSKNDLTALKNEYLSFFDALGRNTQTAQILKEYAELEALYINNVDTAIVILEELVNFGGVQPEFQANVKLQLGDYYLIQGERWEASLLYSQVDKTFKEGVVGENARYKNAKLAYYFGDFAWAQEQFKILKGATSKLISNDAINMSVMILENTGMDTILTPMRLYAQADLLQFQNKYQEALTLLETIIQDYNDHELIDDVYYTKAHIYKKLKDKEKMIFYYNKIINEHADDVRADNALYELAEHYEVFEKNIEKSMELYEKIFIEYSDSTLADEARKKYRILRGDEI